MNGRTNSSPVEIEPLEVPLDPPTNLAASPGNAQVTLTWTDPENKHAVIVGDTAEETDQLVSEFDHSVIVRKNNSDPTSPSDGTVVTTGTKNQYQSTGYIDTSLPNGVEYHYGVYAVNKAGVFSNGIYAHATPMAYRPASTFAAGSILKINISGTPWDFIVVQQGIPTTGGRYDSNCNGTWLLMSKYYTEMAYNLDNDPDFNDSLVKTYLNGDFFNAIDPEYQAIIKSVNVPTCDRDWENISFKNTTASGRVFILSTIELGIDTAYDPSPAYNQGGTLEYFVGTDPEGNEPKRKTTNVNRGYWTRTPVRSTPGYNHAVNGNGASKMDAYIDDDRYGVRPAIIIDSAAMFNDAGELLIE